METQAPFLRELLDSYLAHLRGRGHRPRGVRKYRDQYLLICRFLGERASVADLTESRILDWRDTRASQVAASTLFNELAVIRSISRWCVRRGWLADDPTKHIEYPKLPPPSPRALTSAQLTQLLEIMATRPPNDYAARSWARNRLAILLMLYTGLRISEAAGLRWSHIDLDVGMLIVRGESGAKNGRTRVIPLHAALLNELRQIGPCEPEQAVICSLSGKPMTDGGIAHIFERWLASYGLHISAHQLRHTFATLLLRNGAVLPDIQGLLGHASLETTSIYFTIEGGHLKSAVEKLPDLL